MPKNILAIDPGTTQSAFVLWNGHSIHLLGIRDNEQILGMLSTWVIDDCTLVIEQIRCYGMAIGQTTLDTVFWSGRFWEAWRDEKHLMPRLDVKKHICHNGAAKDSNIRQALIDRFGPPGTKKNPGILYGVKKDIWAALAIAVTYFDTHFKNRI